MEPQPLATCIWQEIGVEAALVVLGHSSLETTQVYAEVNLKRAAAHPSAVPSVERELSVALRSRDVLPARESTFFGRWRCESRLAAVDDEAVDLLLHLGGTSGVRLDDDDVLALQ